jgi:SAM-dependent methyltransferase
MKRYEIARELAGYQCGEKVLDIGCYDGFFLEYICNGKGFGYEIDLEAIKEARKRGVMILSTLDTDFKFDIIVCMEVLEHLKYPEKMVETIKRLARDRIIISLPNECNLWTRIRMVLGLGINDLPFDSEYHIHFPTLKQSEEFVSKHFKIVNKRYWVYGLPQFFRFLPNLFARGVIFECKLWN